MKIITIFYIIHVIIIEQERGSILMKNRRVIGLDIFRGWALLLMIIYHFSYDLNYFHIIEINLNSSIFFQLFRYTIISMFLLSMGISFSLVHRKSISWSKLKKRILLLGLASLAVSVATYLLFPNSWVYFGILHFILLSSLLALPFLKHPKVALVSAILIFIGSATKSLTVHSLFNFLQPILHLPPMHTEDLVSIFPWFGVVLIGTVITYYDIYLKIFTQKIFSSNTPLNKLLKFLGQHSLLIYLIHQPILFVAFESYFKLFSK